MAFVNPMYSEMGVAEEGTEVVVRHNALFEGEEALYHDSPQHAMSEQNVHDSNDGGYLDMVPNEVVVTEAEPERDFEAVKFQTTTSMPPRYHSALVESIFTPPVR
jgi:hypothetical protein